MIGQVFAASHPKDQKPHATGGPRWGAFWESLFESGVANHRTLSEKIPHGQHRAAVAHWQRSENGLVCVLALCSGQG